MTEPAPPGRPSSHRASSGARRALGRLAAPLVAVAVVVIVIVLLIWINGRSGDSSSSAVVTPPPVSAAPPVTSPSISPSAHQRPTRTPSPRQHTPAPHRSTHHTARPTPSTAAASPAAPAFVPVEILNNSRIKGLAHHVAAEVESRGWTISAVGNLRGRVAETTLFYPAGGFAAAQHLESEFGSIERLEPQSEGGLHSSGLVLVVTRFWSD
jgi:cytoskeletal protein RodZ